MSVTRIKCPSNTFLCKKQIEDIIGQQGSNNGLRNLDINVGQCSNSFNRYGKDGSLITECPKVWAPDETQNKTCNNCDYLFENLIKGQTTCKELFENLKNMSPQQIRTQIKYNLNQLIQMRIKLDAVKDSPAFGTFDWWKRYIWGANKIQNYIYFASFVISLLLVIYYTYDFLLKGIGINNLLWIGYTVIVAIILLVIIMYYSFVDQVSYSKPIGDPRYIQDERDKYQKNVRDNFDKDTEAGQTIKYALPLIFVAFFMVAALLVKWILPDSGIGNILTGLAIYSLAGIILSLNMFYTFLIPQFIIIGIVLQKLLVTRFDNIGTEIALNAFIILVLFGISIYGTAIEVTNEPKLKEHDKCKERSRKVGNFSFQYFFIWFVLIMTIIFKVFDLYTGSYFMKSNRGWGLFMEPIFYSFESIFRKFTSK